MENLKFI